MNCRYEHMVSGVESLVTSLQSTFVISVPESVLSRVKTMTMVCNRLQLTSARLALKKDKMVCGLIKEVGVKEMRCQLAERVCRVGDCFCE